jgi:hypothetical protein
MTELPPASALHIDPAGWSRVEDPERRRWEDGSGDQLTVDYFPRPPDLPPLEGTNLEAFFRRGMRLTDTRLVGATTLDIGGVRCVRVISKTPMEPFGVTYAGSVIVPLARCSWVIQVLCVERGITGAKEAILVEKLLAEGSDPQTVTSRVQAEVDDPALDADWPDHPLAKVRATLDLIVDSAAMAPELTAEERLAPGW